LRDPGGKSAAGAHPNQPAISEVHDPRRAKVRQRPEGSKPTDELQETATPVSPSLFLLGSGLGGGWGGGVGGGVSEERWGYSLQKKPWINDNPPARRASKFKFCQ